MTKHTQEPWYRIGHGLFGPLGTAKDIAYGSGMRTDDQITADLDRAALCVNACAPDGGAVTRFIDAFLASSLLDGSQADATRRDLTRLTLLARTANAVLHGSSDK